MTIHLAQESVVSRHRFLLFSLLAALLAAAIYLPGLPGDFVLDDFHNIVNNDTIQLKQLTPSALGQLLATPQISGLTRTLPNLTFALDWWRGNGADAATFKTTNILIHALTALALAWVFRSLLLANGLQERRAHGYALALTLAWATHPLLVSSVLYTVQRLQTMGTLFLVLALTAYLHARRAQIAGRSGRSSLLATLLLWALALSCKEDSALLPAYTLCLELTVLRFSAADAALARRWRRGYLAATLLGTALYLFVIVPRHWSWDVSLGRDFSTPDRLLTQARVLCLYLWQVVLPLPSHMPFYYDWLAPSRGLLQPWTTLASLLLIAALLVLAWRQRGKRPLLALGILLFFGAHFITSNVIKLELAFEHRNHFALIGAVLAIGSLLAEAAQRLQLRPAVQTATCVLLLLTLGGMTILRAHSWSNNVLFSQAATAAAPHSARAWVQLCSAEFTAGGEATPANTRLDSAIAACSNGTRRVPSSLNNAALLLVLKTLKGSITPEDWAMFQHRLETVDVTGDNRRAPVILTRHFEKGVPLDQQQLLRMMDTYSRRTEFSPQRLAEAGFFVLDNLKRPDKATPYFIRAINETPALDPFPLQLAGELRAQGHPEIADIIQEMILRRLSSQETP